MFVPCVVVIRFLLFSVFSVFDKLDVPQQRIVISLNELIPKSTSVVAPKMRADAPVFHPEPSVRERRPIPYEWKPSVGTWLALPPLLQSLANEEDRVVNEQMAPSDLDAEHFNMDQCVSDIARRDFVAVSVIAGRSSDLRGKLDVIFPILLEEMTQSTQPLSDEVREREQALSSEEATLADLQRRMTALFKGPAHLHRRQASQELLDLDPDIAVRAGDIWEQRELLSSMKREVLTRTLLRNLMEQLRAPMQAGDLHEVRRLQERIVHVEASLKQKNPDSPDVKTSAPEDVGDATAAASEAKRFRLAPIAQRGMAGGSNKPPRPHGKLGSGKSHFEGLEKNAHGRRIPR